MKKKRLLVLLVLALFAVGAAGVFTHHVYASNVNTSGIQTQAQTQVCAQDQSEKLCFDRHPQHRCPGKGDY